MKTIAELNLGFTDAQNYTQKANKKFFNDIFVKNITEDDKVNSLFNKNNMNQLLHECFFS